MNSASGAEAPQAPASAETPMEMAGAPGTNGFSAEASAFGGQAGGAAELASALLLALLFSGEESDNNNSSTAKLMLGLAALAMLAPQQGGASASFQASFGDAGAEQSYSQTADIAPTTGANIDVTA
ncbi:MAG: hypothetical protein MPJ50_03390 [Pirellulales bacterium]|nr:hypothetical protein [Pirellulales bacterium]